MIRSLLAIALLLCSTGCVFLGRTVENIDAARMRRQVRHERTDCPVQPGPALPCPEVRR